ncbi:alpha/beta-hydrolase [Gloeophyllum trabeum ATCC 11539]|uniref:Alpha/beta-hydrolase n=1 Tax=Gloeophyllum trabeum (strain ATCC 11539 / FP-39264 / Madison 617) TaxID=670483 RepID=S7RJ53_GLOTA|nr:alpha/beta-hydrolase [Gloeophyllum trabeum ATCC 11539]EPQ52654.1 alpha/beta-hydrolase [Gloeophyllum trabeum ATCC 11539]
MASSAHSVTTKTVTSKADGIKIYAEAIGDPSKQAIVYIHGNSTSSGVWDYQFFDEELLKHFYQIRFDLRGHGLSETPDVESESPFDNDKQGSDVAAVLEGFSVTKPIFVGWSYGALIPGDYVSVHGFDNVKGIVVVDGLTGPPPDVHKFFTGGPYPGFTDNGDATKMHQAYGLFIRALTYQPLPREWQLKLRGMLTETATATRQWIFKRKKNWGPYMEGASKAVPKLVIFGKQDGMNSLDYIDYIKTKWEPSLLTVSLIDDAGHASFLEKPKEFNTALLQWAAKVAQA